MGPTHKSDVGVRERGRPRVRARGDYARTINVGNGERGVSAIAGAALAVWGLRRASLGGLVFAALGGTLVYRGMTGHCGLYERFRINRAPGMTGVRQGNLGIKIDKAVTVDESPEPLYRFWRNLENLPRVMSHLESVTVLGDTRSHWVIKAPIGTRIEWDAEIIYEKPNESIAWRTVGDATVTHAGSVRFADTPDARGTVVLVSLQYDPPGGEIGHALAALLGGDAGRRVEADLREFKQAVETRKLATSIH